MELDGKSLIEEIGSIINLFVLGTCLTEVGSAFYRRYSTQLEGQWKDNRDIGLMICFETAMPTTM